MLTIPVVFVALLTSAFNVAALPVGQPNPVARNAETSPSVRVCTGGVGIGCATIPVVNDTCVNFTGGLTFLNLEVSSAVIPEGLVCTFFGNYGCDAGTGATQAVILTGGTWDFFTVPGTDGTIDFNDKSSSFTCSPI